MCVGRILIFDRITNKDSLLLLLLLLLLLVVVLVVLVTSKIYHVR